MGYEHPDDSLVPKTIAVNSTAFKSLNQDSSTGEFTCAFLPHTGELFFGRYLTFSHETETLYFI